MRAPSTRASNQLSHDLELFVHEITRPAAQVLHRRGARIDPEMVIERGKHFLKIDPPFHAFAAEPIGCADDLPVPHPAASERRTRHARPMIPSPILVDVWRATELTPDDDGNVAIESTLMKILHQ